MALEPVMAAASQLFPMNRSTGMGLITDYSDYDYDSYASYGKGGYGKGKGKGKGKGFGKGNRTQGKGGRGNPIDSSVCFKSGNPGHWKNECTNSYQERDQDITCLKCNTKGHKAEACTMVSGVEDAIVAIS